MSWIIVYGDTPTSRSTAKRLGYELPRARCVTPSTLATPDGRPVGVLVDAAAVSVRQLRRKMREHLALSGVPVIALVPHPTEGAFLDAVNAGADDVVPAGDLRALAGIRHELDAMARAGAPLVRPLRVTRPAPSSFDDQRIHVRVAHETLCSYRVEGEMWPRFASTWDLSEQGLFVRTLAPPEAGSPVWLELRPPGRLRARQLRGEVVWRNRPTEPVGPTTPPGFGVRLSIEHCAPADAAAFVRAARELAQGQRRVA